MSDFSVYKSIEASRVGANTDISNAAAPVAQAHTHQGEWRIANVTAGVTEEPIGSVKYRANLIGASITMSAAAVANATDYNVVNIFKRTGSGAAVTMGTANLSNVAITGFVTIPLTLVTNSANTQLAAGDMLSCNVSKTGNGVANNPVGSLSFVFEDT